MRLYRPSRAVNRHAVGLRMLKGLATASPASVHDLSVCPERQLFRYLLSGLDYVLHWIGRVGTADAMSPVLIAVKRTYSGPSSIAKTPPRYCRQDGQDPTGSSQHQVCASHSNQYLSLSHPSTSNSSVDPVFTAGLGSLSSTRLSLPGGLMT